MSITSEQEYLAQLHQIQNLNPPSVALLPKAEQVYDIDLVTRTIKAPEFLSVAHDHKSETVYFRVDRFFDYMDLSNTVCVIQYISPDNEPHIYAVPFYDISTEKDSNKMLLPWCIDGAATKKAGVIKYSVRFYLVEGEKETAKLIYNLNTIPTSSKVLYGMNVQETKDNFNSPFDIPAEGYDTLLAKIQEVSRNTGVKWTFVTNK